jgi:hypothetical protein
MPLDLFADIGDCEIHRRKVKLRIGNIVLNQLFNHLGLSKL